MWFRKKKEQEPDLNDIYIKDCRRHILELEEKFPKGSRFKYLGVDCIVTKTWELYPDYMICTQPWVPCPSIPYLATRPKLFADYVDKNGVIREISFSYAEAMRIETN